MDAPDGVNAVEIGQCAGDTQHAMIAAGRKPHPLHGFGQQPASVLVRGRRAVEQGAVGFRVGAHRRFPGMPLIAFSLDVSGRGDPPGDIGGALGGRW